MPLLQLAGCFFAGTAVEAVVNVVRGATNRGTSILSSYVSVPVGCITATGALLGRPGGATVGRWPGSESDGTGGGGRGCGGPGCGPGAWRGRLLGRGALARAAHLRRDRGSDAMEHCADPPLVGAELGLLDAALGGGGTGQPWGRRRGGRSGEERVHLLPAVRQPRRGRAAL